MGFVICETHGGKVGGMVSKNLYDEITKKNKPMKIMRVGVEVDGIEISSNILLHELNKFEDIIGRKFDENGFAHFIIEEEEQAEAFLKEITIVCPECLKEYADA